jgi:lysozyme family protein
MATNVTIDVIGDIIKREGGVSNQSGDKGGLTFEGISQKSNPELFKNGLPTDAQVRATYEAKYIVGPGFDKITDKLVQNQLIDWGVNSGPAVAISALQRIVGVPVDGVLGPGTLSAVSSMHPDDVNTSLVAERVKMIGRLITANPLQAKFASGWLNRAVEFLR